MFSPKERDAKRETVERSREWRHWRVVVPGKCCCWLAQAGGVESSRTPEATFRNRRGHKGGGPPGPGVTGQGCDDGWARHLARAVQRGHRARSATPARSRLKERRRSGDGGTPSAHVSCTAATWALHCMSRQTWRTRQRAPARCMATARDSTSQGAVPFHSGALRMVKDSKSRRVEAESCALCCAL